MARSSVVFILIIVLFSRFSWASSYDPHRSEKLDLVMNEAILRGLIAGGVVIVGSHREIHLERAYGRTSSAVDARPMEVDEIFDLASLTKVVATTPSILKLAEEGRLSLVDPVTMWFPEFAGRGKDDLLVMHLLTHTSGLDDFSLSPVDPLQHAVEGAAGQKLKGEVGSRFRYADINFILLGEMVHRATGLSLDQYAHQQIFIPTGMKDTSFKPDDSRLTRCSATLTSSNVLLVGQVQDDNARQLGGVAGHAGLFGTAQDLARFSQMLLDEGEHAGRQILSNRAVRQMTAPYFSRGGNVIRGLGWDIASPYSSPKGTGFSEGSFGHTGYSGGSLWIDPDADLFVVLLTSRLDYRNTREFNALRKRVSSLAAELYGPFPWTQELTSSPL
ncbi:serine hydrolase domain-containing protein [Geobacter sp. DSM 9736]|uniref:serine hydrolase domain-containing protein n=1 Tax=Geobacter sp. DSM 9736 TaxID=1277350 RepID=UPI003512A94E